MDDRLEWYELNIVDWQDLKTLSEREERLSKLPPPSPVKPDYIPMPLTEDWLLKCGFAKTVGRRGEYFHHGLFKGMRIWVDETTGSYQFGRKCPETNTTGWIRGGLKHLHQLQNLYKELTGKELEASL